MAKFSERIQSRITLKTVESEAGKDVPRQSTLEDTLRYSPMSWQDAAEMGVLLCQSIMEFRKNSRSNAPITANQVIFKSDTEMVVCPERADGGKHRSCGLEILSRQFWDSSCDIAFVSAVLYHALIGRYPERNAEEMGMRLSGNPDFDRLVQRGLSAPPNGYASLQSLQNAILASQNAGERSHPSSWGPLHTLMTVGLLGYIAYSCFSLHPAFNAALPKLVNGQVARPPQRAFVPHRYHHRPPEVRGLHQRGATWTSADDEPTITSADHISNRLGLTIYHAQQSESPGALLLEAAAAGASLRNADLRHMQLGQAKLKGLNLRGCDLTRSNLGQADLSGCDLRDATIEHTNFCQTHLNGANLTGCTVVNSYFGQATLNGAKFARTKMTNVLFCQTKAEDASFEDSHLGNAYFGQAYLDRAKFRKANLEGATFCQADLKSTDFTGARLTDVSFSQARFKQTAVDGVSLVNSDFDRINDVDAFR